MNNKEMSLWLWENLFRYYKKADGKCSYTINTTKTEAGEREIPMTDEVKSAFLAVKEFYDDTVEQQSKEGSGFDFSVKKSSAPF